MNRKKRNSSYSTPHDYMNKEYGEGEGGGDITSRHIYLNNKEKNENDTKENRGPENFDNFGRKIWDKDYFKKKAEEKTTNEEDELILKLLPDLNKKKNIPPPLPPSERKLLEERKEILSLDKNLGKVQIITQKTTKEEQGGYYCKICDCVLKDSQTYLDHINGKNHNRMLGYSMKVKKVTLNDVVNKLNILRDAKRKKSYENDDHIDIDPEARAKKKLLDLQQQDEMKMQKRKEKKFLKKLEKQRKIQEQAGQQPGQTSTSIGAEDQHDDETMQIKELGLPTSFV
ncbi:hypothetical protein, conserved [Plasmodium gonderi]|uniref:U1-type domain-containing protein n=1 Tax=Plasmodium gonderi TaxID=77519 RepID=A0A1Y1JMI2_PLAGO|nr:hypothetical protein, conserved [Plasmodium gonderi]GAW83796.1 hypothetical protein, conserved [Plasmodium gonderi]